QAYPEKDLKPCPYSAEHMVPSADLMHHMHTCPLNTTVERFLTVSETSKPSGNVSVPPYHSQDVVQTEENWDDEVSVATTLEDKIAEPAVTPIFMNVQRMLPAERRHFYKSLHAKVDETVPESMRPRVLESPSTLPIPRQPRTEPKIYLPKAPVPAPTRQDSDSDNESEDESEDDSDIHKAEVYRMGIGRGCSRAAPNMRLLGLGRGRGMSRN
ncbi:unnamed protein product, partial [Ixodes hexagonus]